MPFCDFRGPDDVSFGDENVCPRKIIKKVSKS